MSGCAHPPGGALVDDGLSGVSGILAPQRASVPGRRPLSAEALPSGSDPCPFCPGREELCGRERERVGGDEWELRAVENLHPIAPGSHEVVVLSRSHDQALAASDAGPVAAALALVHSRAWAAAASGAAAVVAFMNVGVAAGASQPHPHAQVVGLPFIPPALVRESSSCARECLVCSEDEDLTVVVQEGVRIWVPHVSVPGPEVRLAPVAHSPWPASGSEEGLARALLLVLSALESEFGPFAYNLLWHLQPGDAPFHWHLHLVPRVHVPAGFELAAGMQVVRAGGPALAERLRSHLP